MQRRPLKQDWVLYLSLMRLQKTWCEFWSLQPECQGEHDAMPESKNMHLSHASYLSLDLTWWHASVQKYGNQRPEGKPQNRLVSRNHCSTWAWGRNGSSPVSSTHRDSKPWHNRSSLRSELLLLKLCACMCLNSNSPKSKVPFTCGRIMLPVAFSGIFQLRKTWVRGNESWAKESEGKE